MQVSVGCIEESNGVTYLQLKISFVFVTFYLVGLFNLVDMNMQ